jgi:hypothetical protein
MEIIREALLAGKSIGQIADTYRPVWKCSYDAVWRIYDQLFKDYAAKEDDPLRRLVTKDEARARFTELRNLAQAAGKYSEAIFAQQCLSRLDGHFEDRMVVRAEVGPPRTREGELRYLAELVKREPALRDAFQRMLAPPIEVEAETVKVDDGTEPG